MASTVWRACWVAVVLAPLTEAADFKPAPQHFSQELAQAHGPAHGMPATPAQLLDIYPGGPPRAFVAGVWYALESGRWRAVPTLTPGTDAEFVIGEDAGSPVRIPLPWDQVRQVARRNNTAWIVTSAKIAAVENGQFRLIDPPEEQKVNQIAVGPDNRLFAACSGGLFERTDDGWAQVLAPDNIGRAWARGDVAGIAFDSRRRLWFASKAGVGCRGETGWQFYEGEDGLPWNDFTHAAAGADGEMWFGTRLGAIRFDGHDFQYRQGRRWLPNDQVRDIAVDGQGKAWFATAGGVGCIERRPFTLAEKAAIYEDETDRYIKRTPFGYVAEAPLSTPADKSSARPHDSDNDGLWTSMYGAGECFAWAATRDPKARERARQAFEALRFLQIVTQGGPHSPPKGFVARTIRPTDWPDPNAGRLERDRQVRKGDALWKVYEPRWPMSNDGHWYWKSDTSSDELDGHYFFYPLYFDLCAETDAEKDRVRQVVRDLTDHLLTHNYVLIDHDGRPTRWAIYGPQYLNGDPRWYPERGLNSLSILSYLAVAAHVTGDAKYAAASRELIDKHGYHQNAMYPKVQYGPGSGNQSDDEMAFMCFYSLLRCSTDERLKDQIRFALFGYWANEEPEMNPLFNFACAVHCLDATVANPFGRFPLKPWKGWFEDAIQTLRGFPIDRLNWSHRNSHRLDIVPLRPQQSTDLYEPDERTRGFRVNGKVLPVENRHFNHWNTDPWALDYGGEGDVLASGTVFLLPYYMGMYHGFIEKPDQDRQKP